MRNDNYTLFYKAISLSAVLLPAVRFNLTLFCAYFYFPVFQAVLVPQLISRTKDPKMAFLLHLTAIAGYTVIFFLRTLVPGNGITPYNMFWM